MPAIAQAESTEHWGVAKNTNGKIIYTENHLITKKDGKLFASNTDYFDQTRKNKFATLKSDYSRSLSLPTYEFVDMRTGYLEGVRYVDGKYLVYFKKPDETEIARPLKEGDSIFSGQGWHYYLIENLDILENQNIKLNLVLPSELDFYSFEIKHSKATKDKIVANLELSNWFLSFFAPKLQLVYDKKFNQLIEFKGISNILDKDGERQEVTIHYEYDGSQDKER